MFIADLQARNPPMLHIGMIAVGDVQRPPATQLALVAMIEVLKAVEIVEIPHDRGVFAIYLQSIKRLVAARVSRRLEVGERAVAEARQESAGIVDPNLLDLASDGVVALLDESFGHARYAVDAAVEPQSRVDAVSEQITGDAASRHADVEPPQTRTALRKVF